MKGSSAPGLLLQQARGRKALAVAVSQPLQNVEYVASPQGVRVPEGSAEKRREAQPEHGADVSVARRSQNLLLEAANRLREEREDEPVLYLARLERDATRLRDESVDAGVDALSFALHITVEAATVLPPQPALVERFGQGGRRREALPEARLKDADHLRADVALLAYVLFDMATS